MNPKPGMIGQYSEQRGEMEKCTYLVHMVDVREENWGN
jgi:hypothetical protein